MRRLVTISVVSLMLATVTTAAAAAPPDGTSGPVTHGEIPTSFAFFDAAAGLIALVGPPPEQGCVGEGFDDHLARLVEVETSSGAVVRLLRSDALDVYVFAADSIEDICGPVQAGEAPEPVAAGTVRGTGTDNDVEVSGTRTNTFGARLVGTLQGADGGPCHLNAQFHGMLDRAGAFRLINEWIRLDCR